MINNSKVNNAEKKRRLYTKRWMYAWWWLVVEMNEHKKLTWRKFAFLCSDFLLWVPLRSTSFEWENFCSLLVYGISEFNFQEKLWLKIKFSLIFLTRENNIKLLTNKKKVKSFSMAQFNEVFTSYKLRRIFLS